MKSDYGRSVKMVCPTCANDQFDYDNSIPETDRQYRCKDCNSSFSHDQIIAENGPAIESAVADMKSEIVKDMEKRLKKALKNFK